MKALTTTYKGIVHPDNVTNVVTVDGEMLDPRYDLRSHSPTGFAWGYGGSGPSQLALAILADYTQDDIVAEALYQTFKWDVISKLPQGKNWELTGEEIEKFFGRVNYVSSN